MKFEFEIVLNGVPEYEEIDAPNRETAEAIAATRVSDYVQWSIREIPHETPATAAERLRAA